ncbi:MAG: hypothetical protein LBS20_09205 [Prevotella sp.]|jgi:hypothetical protein|nr:hypothetical protein [Prevotella sp.]
MEKYAPYIIEALSSREISSFYHKDEKLVYSLKESAGGLILGTYGCTGSILRNICIYNRLLVPSQKIAVRKYLEKLNRKISGGYFLTNPNIEYIIFTSQYEVPAQGMNPSIPDFTSFCSCSHEIFDSHIENFRQILNTSPCLQ